MPAPATRRSRRRAPAERAWPALPPRRRLFCCPGCGLHFPVRRAADPSHRPLCCVCCWLLANLPNQRLRESLRRGMAVSGVRRIVFGGRGDGDCRP